MKNFAKTYGPTIILCIVLLSVFGFIGNQKLEAPSVKASFASIPTLVPEGETTNSNTDIDNSPQRVSPVRITGPLDFAGEWVPLDKMDVRERLDREILVNTFWHSSTWLNLKKANKYFDDIERELRKHGIPDDFKYLAIAESGLQNVRSPAGAQGFWQFIKSTGQYYGLRIDSEVDERNDYIKSTEAACKYLKDAKVKFGSWTLAAASYNMGMPKLEKRIKEQKVDNYYDLYLNKETARYIYRILAYKSIFESPEKFGFHYEDEDLYQPYDYMVVKVDSSITDLASFAISYGSNYKMLKTANPWILGDKLTYKTGTTPYTIKIPVE